MIPAPPNFSAHKLQLALRIMLVGLVASLAFHFYQGAVLARDYPYNTFLFRPEIRFTDFYDVLRSTQNWDPYSTWSLYFPFTYVVFRPLELIPWVVPLVFFFAGSLIGLWKWVVSLLRRALPAESKTPVAALLLIGMAYPILLCLDRGNIELGLFALVAGFLTFARKRRYWTSLAFMVPAMCIKLYPAVLLALYLRRGKLKYAAVAGAACAIITMLSLTAFQHEWRDDLARWQQQLALFRGRYLIGNGSMGGSANLWNPVKLALFSTVDLDATGAERQAIIRDLKLTLERALPVYSLCMALLAIAVTWHVSVVEKEFWRKVALLLLFMVLAPPGGADYKMVYLVGVLTGMIVLSTRRRSDLAIVALLALVLIPKKYVFFPGIGTDSGAEDVALSVLINPALMLAAAALLCRDGWSHSTPRGRALRWTHAWTALAWWVPKQMKRLGEMASIPYAPPPPKS